MLKNEIDQEGVFFSDDYFDQMEALIDEPKKKTNKRIKIPKINKENINKIKYIILGLVIISFAFGYSHYLTKKNLTTKEIETLSHYTNTLKDKEARYKKIKYLAEVELQVNNCLNDLSDKVIKGESNIDTINMCLSVIPKSMERPTGYEEFEKQINNIK